MYANYLGIQSESHCKDHIIVKSCVNKKTQVFLAATFRLDTDGFIKVLSVVQRKFNNAENYVDFSNF